MRRSHSKKITVAKHFGLALKERRVEAGLTQEELANLSGLHRTTIGLFERGIKSPSLDTLIRLADSLGIAPEVLVTETVNRLGGGKK